MKKHAPWLLLIVLLALVAGGITRAILARKAQQAALAQSSASAQSSQTLLGDKDVYTVGLLPLSQGVAVSGSLMAQRTALIKAKVAAEVRSLKVREGDRVQAGQLLAQLDTQDLTTRLQQARQQAAASHAQWQIARQALENNQALVQQGFISRTALDTSQASAAAARATYEAAQSAVELASKALQDATVRSPIDGLVSQRFVQTGERVAVDARMLEVVDLDSLELQAALSQRNLLQVRVGTPATLHIDGLPEPLMAKVARINPSASPDTRAVMVYLSVPRQPALRQGLFAQGQIQLQQGQALAVPTSAVLRDGGQDHVLRLEGKMVRRAAVQLGELTGQTPDGQTLREVRQGLQAGEQVLSNASGTVREGQLVKRPAPASASPIR